MVINVLTDVLVQFGSFDLSPFATSVKVEYSADEVESTAFSPNATHINIGGLKAWSVEVEANQDVVTTSLLQTLFALVGTTATLLVRNNKTAAVSVNNPNFSGSAMLQSLPFGGGVGELSKTSIKFSAAGVLSLLTS